MKEYTPKNKVASRTLDKKAGTSRRTPVSEIIQSCQTKTFQHPADYVIQRYVAFQNGKNRHAPLIIRSSYDGLKEELKNFGSIALLEELLQILISIIKEEYNQGDQDPILQLDLAVLQRFINSVLCEDNVLAHFSFISSSKTLYNGTRTITVDEAICQIYTQLQIALTNVDYIDMMRDYLTPPAPALVFDHSNINSQLSGIFYILPEDQIGAIKVKVPKIQRGTLENAMNTLARPYGQNGIKVFDGIYELKIMSMGDYRVYGTKVEKTVTFNRISRGLGH